MIVVRDTSRGRIVLDFTYVDEEGWVVDFVRWNSGARDERSLADAIVEAASVSKDEAEELAQSALQQLHERGGDESEMTRRDWLRPARF